MLSGLRETPVSLLQWAAGFAAVVFVRFFLEGVADPSWSGYFPADASTWIHYALFYLAAAVSLMLVLRAAVGPDPAIPLLGLLGTVALWIGPALDFLFAPGRGFTLAYLLSGREGLARDFIYFFVPGAVKGATPGIQIEILLILSALAAYVILRTRSVPKGILAAFAGYCILFVFGALPSILAPSPLPLEYIRTSAEASFLNSGILRPDAAPSSLRRLELQFNAVIGLVFFLLSSILVLSWFLASKRHLLRAVARNIRPERVAHFWLMFSLGLGLALFRGSANPAWNWIDILAVLAGFLVYLCAWLSAVAVNDIHDLPTDKISNPARPLPRGEISSDEMRDAGIFFFLWALCGSFLLGEQVFFFTAAALAVSYAYSAPPLRLKRIVLLSSALVALGAVLPMLAGFYLVNPEKTVDAFPLRFLILVWTSVFLGAHIKDLKDIRGDSATGALTLPVLLGDKNGRFAAAVLFALAFWLVPVILREPRLVLLSWAAGVAGYVLVAHRFPEKTWFILYFSYAAAVLWLGL